jgi:hypothetical protein
MILRRFMQHVTQQNWFAVGLDMLVVIFGVYIGIYLGEVANERSIRSDVQDALGVVRAQLEEDLKAVDRIIAYRQEKLEEPKLLLPVIARDEMDKASFGEDLTESFGSMYTFFPKSSGYMSMKDLGFLARLDDPELLEALAYLFDQVYVRHVVIADVYWNLNDPGFIGDEDIARARIGNALAQLASYSEWYVQFLSETLRPGIIDALEAIEAHQGGKI